MLDGELDVLRLLACEPEHGLRAHVVLSEMRTRVVDDERVDELLDEKLVASPADASGFRRQPRLR